MSSNDIRQQAHLENIYREKANAAMKEQSDFIADIAKLYIGKQNLDGKTAYEVWKLFNAARVEIHAGIQAEKEGVN